MHWILSLLPSFGEQGFDPRTPLFRRFPAICREIVRGFMNFFFPLLYTGLPHDVFGARGPDQVPHQTAPLPRLDQVEGRSAPVDALAFATVTPVERFVFKPVPLCRIDGRVAPQRLNHRTQRWHTLE